MLDVKRLKVLREVARSGSFSAAAEELGYTQPAISQQISALEREAGTRLLQRGFGIAVVGTRLLKRSDGACQLLRRQLPSGLDGAGRETSSGKACATAAEIGSGPTSRPRPPIRRS